MRLRSIKDAEEFMSTVDKCKGNVFLTSQYGDRYNLKSKLTQLVAVGEIIKDENNALELWCDDKDDERMFLGFFCEHPEV